MKKSDKCNPPVSVILVRTGEKRGQVVNVVRMGMCTNPRECKKGGERKEGKGAAWGRMTPSTPASRIESMAEWKSSTTVGAADRGGGQLGASNPANRLTGGTTGEVGEGEGSVCDGAWGATHDPGSHTLCRPLSAVGGPQRGRATSVGYVVEEALGGCERSALNPSSLRECRFFG